MTVDVRPIREEETSAWLDTVSTAFLDRPDISRVAEEVRPLWDYARVWGAFEPGSPTVVGTTRTWASEISLPGGALVPASAVAAVTVRPTHRRRGILRQLMAAENEAARERGEAASILHAAEYPIYGRFGYGPATRWATWTLDAAGSDFHAAATGTIDLLMPGPEARDVMMAIFEVHRLRQPGEIRRRDFSWEVDLGLRDLAWGQTWKGFLAVHRSDSGEPDGYARYRAEEKWLKGQPRGIISVDELHALTDGAYAALWRFLAEVDLVATVKAERRSVAEALPWLLTNARAANLSEVGDALWVKLLDLPRVLGARTYGATGRLVLEAVEAGPDERRRRVLLDATPEGATCRPSDRSPDLTVSAAALGAACLGGTRLRQAAVAGGWDEHRTGAMAEADRLFATLDEPWCSTFF